MESLFFVYCENIYRAKSNKKKTQMDSFSRYSLKAHMKYWALFDYSNDLNSNICIYINQITPMRKVIFCLIYFGAFEITKSLEQ